MVIVQIKAMATMAIKVFNIIVIAVLILRRAQWLKVLQDEPRHHTEDRNQHKGNHGGDYLASMRVMMKLCTVTIVTMHIMVSIQVFKWC